MCWCKRGQVRECRLVKGEWENGFERAWGHLLGFEFQLCHIWERGKQLNFLCHSFPVYISVIMVLLLYYHSCDSRGKWELRRSQSTENIRLPRFIQLKSGRPRLLLLRLVPYPVCKYQAVPLPHEAVSWLAGSPFHGHMDWCLFTSQQVASCP